MTVFFKETTDGTLATIGLDVNVRKDRPLLLFHPACDRNYASSWQLLLDIGAEFIHICNDISLLIQRCSGMNPDISISQDLVT